MLLSKQVTDWMRTQVFLSNENSSPTTKMSKQKKGGRAYKIQGSADCTSAVTAPSTNRTVTETDRIIQEVYDMLGAQ